MRLSVLFLLLFASSGAFAQGTDTLVLTTDRVYYGTLAQNINAVTDTLRFRVADQRGTQRFSIKTVRELRLANGKRLRVVAAFPGEEPLLSTYLVSGEVSLLRSDKLPVVIGPDGEEYILTKNNFRLRIPSLLPLNAELAARLENSDFRITEIESILVDHYQATGRDYATYPWRRNFTIDFFAGGGLLNNIIETSDATGTASFQDGDLSSVSYFEGGIRVRFPPLLYATLGLRYAEFTGQLLANRPTTQAEPLYFRSDLRALMLPIGLNLTYSRSKLRPVIGGEFGPGIRIGGSVYREFPGDSRRDYETSNNFFGFRLHAGIAYRFDSKLEVSLRYVYDDYSAISKGEGFNAFGSRARGVGLRISY